MTDTTTQRAFGISDPEGAQREWAAMAVRGFSRELSASLVTRWKGYVGQEYIDAEDVPLLSFIEGIGNMIVATASSVAVQHAAEAEVERIFRVEAANTAAVLFAGRLPA